MPRELSIASHYGTEVAVHAARQHGVVSLSQLEEIGMSASGVRNWVARGRLHRVHRGVYAVGHAKLTREGRWMAAVLACGPGAVLSHQAAGAHLGIRSSRRGMTDVTAPRRVRRRAGGIHVHVCPRLQPDDVTAVDGIPCTSVARTLLDLAAVVDRRGVERAIEQAGAMRLLYLPDVEAVLSRAGRRRGSRVLRSVLAAFIGDTVTREEFEERLLALCRSAGLPHPKVNFWIAFEDGGGVEADFAWPDARLVVECDSYAFHRGRDAFERDRSRVQRLMLIGWRVMPLTWWQLNDDPDRVVRMVVELIRTGPWSAAAHAGREG